MKFTTDWKKIGQSGPTMDGREIDPAWLQEAAEAYDPATYTAVIWIDHYRFWGNQGKVVELKAVEEDGVVSLYARLQPNEHLLSWNKENQKLFTSMELTPDFAKSGKCYLSGLAVTDTPASLGTHELHFSHRKQNPTDLFLCGVELGDLEEGGQKDSLMPQWFTNWLEDKGKDIPNNQGATPEPEEDPMDAKQFSKVMDGLDSIAARQETLEKQFSALNPEKDEEGKGPAAGAIPEEGGGSSFSTELSEAMKPFSDKLDGMKDEFSGQIDALTQRFEKANPGTAAPETIIPAAAGVGIA